MSASARWGALLILALVVGGWSGRVAGAPPGGVVAQSGGTSSSGSGSSGASGSGDSGSSGGGDSGGSGGGDSGSSGGGDSGGSGGDGSGDDGSGGGDGSGGDGGDGGDGSTATTAGDGSTATTTGDGSTGTTTGDGGTATTEAPPDVPEEAIATGEETDCGGSTDGRRCYEVEQVDGVEAVRVPDGQGGTVIVALGDAPQVNIDSGASTSASSNVDYRVDIDIETGDVIRVERRFDPVRQFALITLAALLGVFVGAAVLGTFLRFRNGRRPQR